MVQILLPSTIHSNHKDYCPDMKAYIIGRVEYAQGEVKSQKDAVLFED